MFCRWATDIYLFRRCGRILESYSTVSELQVEVNTVYTYGVWQTVFVLPLLATVGICWILIIRHMILAEGRTECDRYARTLPKLLSLTVARRLPAGTHIAPIGPVSLLSPHSEAFKAKCKESLTGFAHPLYPWRTSNQRLARGSVICRVDD